MIRKFYDMVLDGSGAHETANDPAYPAMDTNNIEGNEVVQLRYPGLTKREKLAMEIYVRTLLSKRLVRSFLTGTDSNTHNDVFLETAARSSLRAADIFFEQLNK